MSSSLRSLPCGGEKISDLLQRLGDVSPQRVCAVPPPGLAREQDLLAHASRTDCACELVDGTLVEKVMEGNTVGEMRRKLQDYFQAGVRLVWYIDPATRTAEAYTAPDQRLDLGPGGVLDGGDVLPGFRLPLAELFSRAEGRLPGGSAG